jgi:hypothetical protein
MNFFEMLVFFCLLFVTAFAGHWVITGKLSFFVPGIIAWSVCVLIAFAPLVQRLYKWLRKGGP